MKLTSLSLIAVATAVSVYCIVAPVKKLQPSPTPESAPEMVAAGELPLENLPIAQRAPAAYKVVFEPVTVIGRASHGHRR